MKKLIHDPALSPHQPVAAAAGDKWSDALPLVDAALHSLKEGERQVLVLRYLRGLSFEDMAREFGGAAAAWRQRGGRALERLRARLGARGVALPAAAVMSGLTILGAHKAPAALVITLSSGALATASEWQAAVWHFIHSMSTNKITLTAAALALLAAPVVWQITEHRQRSATVRSLEKEVAAAREAVTIVPPWKASAAANEVTAASAAVAEEEKIDLAAWAADLYEGNRGPSGVVKAMPVMKRIAELDAAAVLRLLASQDIEGISDLELDMLLGQLLLRLCDLDPKAAVTQALAARARLSGDKSNRVTNALQVALQKWAAREPREALAWLRDSAASGALESRGIRDPFASSRHFAASVFRGLLQSDAKEAEAFLSSLDPAGRSLALTNAGLAIREQKEVAPLVPLIRGLPEKERAQAAQGVLGSIARIKGLDAMKSLAEQLDLSPPWLAKAMVYGTSQGVIGRISQQEMAKRVDWLRAAAPAEQSDRSVGELLGIFFTRQKDYALALLDQEHTAHPSDAMLSAFIGSTPMLHANTAAARDLVKRFQSDVARREAQAMLDERFAPQRANGGRSGPRAVEDTARRTGTARESTSYAPSSGAPANFNSGAE
jgi:hypothetical protein